MVQGVDLLIALMRALLPLLMLTLRTRLDLAQALRGERRRRRGQCRGRAERAQGAVMTLDHLLHMRQQVVQQVPAIRHRLRRRRA